MISSRTFLFFSVGSVVLLLIFISTYPTLKLRYVISRVESAKTSTEERAAFRLVRQNYYASYRAERLTDPKNSWVKQGGEFVIKINGIPPFTGRQYFARRILLADTNFDYLEGSYGTPVRY